MIPVYNGGDIIQEVIEHLLSQGLEIVILDNGSTDESRMDSCGRGTGKICITRACNRTSKPLRLLLTKVRFVPI